MDKLFRIGEVAKMFHMSVGILRYYEKEGLLKPEYTDKFTGYRYYSAAQFEILNTIRYLRVLDMPLPQIAEFLKNRDVDLMKSMLLRQIIYAVMHCFIMAVYIWIVMLKF